MNKDTKAEALDTIASLAKTHNLSIDEIGAVITKAHLKDKDASWLNRLLGYLGGAFIFGGLALFIAVVWDDLGSVARVTITYGSGLVAFILGVVVLKDERYVRASTPLFLKSAVLLPTGMFVFLHEYASGDDRQLAAMIVFGLLAFQFLGAFASFKRTSLLFFGFLFWNGALGIFMDRAGVEGELLGLTLGLSILAFAWSIDRTEHRPIAPFWYFIGGIGFLWSVFDIVEGHAGLDVLYLFVAVGMMLLSTRIHSRTLLLVSTFALLGFLGYFTGEYFANVIGWPIALMLMGFMLIGVSAYAVKLGNAMKPTS